MNDEGWQPYGSPKTSAADWITHCMGIQSLRERCDPHPNIVVTGLLSGMSKHYHSGADYIYVDHSYFNKGWDNGMFRAIRKNIHMAAAVKRPFDRVKKFGLTLQPWRKTGRRIVVIPPSGSQIDVLGVYDWVPKTVAELRKHTERPIFVKWDKSPMLYKILYDVWAVVSWGSAASIEAAINGVPVFSTPHDPAWQINAGMLRHIDTPVYHERKEWLAALTYCCWNKDEVRDVRWLDYNYALCDDLS